MTSYHYTTVFFDGEPFYVFTKHIRSKVSIGCIPAGISYEYRKRIYSTSLLLTLLCNKWKEGGTALITQVLSGYKTPRDWKGHTRSDFVKLFK